MSQRVNLKLDWATHEAARYACANWHYSRTLVPGKNVRIGAWEANVFVGVIVFSYGAAINLLKPYGLVQIEGCELVRIAMREHSHPISKMLSVAIKMLKKQSPGLKLIVSFADPFRDHYGGIYQASNWIYTGRSSPDRFYKDKSGAIYHARQVSEAGNIKRQFGRKVNRLDARNLEKIIMPGKHRYLYPLCDEMRIKIEHLRKPYPKRAVNIDNDVSPNHGEKGGVIPTTALQYSENNKNEVTT